MSLTGARPFSSRAEIDRTRLAMEGRQRYRDRALLTLGIRTGYRVSEILSLTIGDVLEPCRRFRAEIYVRRRSMKARRAGRRLPFHPEAQFAVGRHLVALRQSGLTLDPRRPLFGSEKGGHEKALDRRSAHRIIARAACAAGLPAGIGTHSWRKWLAVRVYERTGHCLVKTGAILGHSQIETTWRYCRSIATDAERLLIDL